MKNLTPAKVTLMMFGVIGLLIAAYVVKTLFAVEAKPTTRNLPMAISDLAPGTRVTENHIGLGPWPISEVRKDMLLSDRAILGRVVKETIKAGTPILANQLYQHGVRPPIEIEEGMRAISIDISESSAAVGGMIRPGQYVDVHFTVTEMRNDPRLKHGMTLILFRGVRIVAVGRRVEVGPQGNMQEMGVSSATLEVTPEQANILILAKQKGTLTLTYNPDGKGTGVIDVPDENRATLDEILGLAPIPEPVDTTFFAEVYRRTSRQSMKFENGRLSQVTTGGGMRQTSRVGTTDAGPAPTSQGLDAVPPPPDSVLPATPQAVEPPPEPKNMPPVSPEAIAPPQV